jgi:hypothetical protein
MARPEKPGAAYIWSASQKKWVVPPKPKTKGQSYTWDADRGWVSKEEQSEKYGFALSVIKADKDLNKLFSDAWSALSKKTEWSKEKFVLELKKTNWYKTRSEAQRKYFVMQNDPSQAVEFQDVINNQKNALSVAAKSEGAILTDQQLDSFAKESLLNGWDSVKTTTVLSDYINYSKDPATGVSSLLGAAGNVEDQIRQYATQMGVAVTDDFVLREAQYASTSSGDIDRAKNWIRARSKEKYSIFSEDLDSNPDATIEDLSYNYRKSMADMFEIGIDEVKMSDPRIKSALEGGDGQGGKKTVFQFEQELRKDPAWTKTKNAKESTQGIVNDILSTFGLM